MLPRMAIRSEIMKPRASEVSRGDEAGHLALPTAGERDQPLGMGGQHLRLHARLAPLVVQVGVAEQTAEVGVAALRLAEKGQVGPLPRPLSLWERGRG